MPPRSGRNLPKLLADCPRPGEGTVHCPSGGHRERSRAVTTLTTPKDCKLIGRPVKRLDTRDKLTGAQIYGEDLRLPGMLNAAIKDCPVSGGTVQTHDAAKVAGRAGVRHVLRVGDSAVAVLADTWWQAKTALDALPITWNEGAHATVSSAGIAEMLKVGVGAEPFLNHAPMEPMNPGSVSGSSIPPG